MTEVIKPIPSRIKSGVVGGYVTGAADIIDDEKNMSQAAVNAAVDAEIGSDDTEGTIKGRIADLEEAVGPGGSVEEQIQAAIAELDATESQTAGTDGLALSVTEVDGVITGISGSIATNTYDSYGAASTVETNLLGDAGTNYNTLGKLEDAIQSEASTRETEIGTDSTSGTVKGRIKSLETLVGSTSVDSQIDTKINALDVTKSQTAGADGLALSIEEENGKIKSISGSIAANTYDAYGAASTAKSDLLGDAASDYNTLGKLEDAIQTEATTRGNADTALDGRLDAVEEVIPSAATSTNQLADKSFVNSSVSTATATFRGTSATGLTEQQFLTWANSLTKDANDYVFWNTADAAGTPQFKRYKYNGSAWVYEYTLNNSSFTADQWATINSLLTSTHKTKLDALPTNAELTTLFEGKEDVISDLATIRSGAAAGATAYQKPSTGIPYSDMTSAVQASLGKVDSAYQKPATGIPSTDLASGVQTSLGKADTAIQSDDLATVATSGSYNDLDNKPTLATVATSGSYNDLIDKPSIPSGQIQADWNQTNTSEVDYIKNKPTIPTVPTNVSAFTNDAGYLTDQDVSGKANKSEMDISTSGDKTTITLKSGTSATVINAHQDLSGKQDKLVSGTNIKTINGTSVLGSGNISIEAGSALTPGDGISIANDVVSVKAGSNLSFGSDGKLNATDTTYSAATTSASGLMSSADKTKLNGIAEGAEVNQNAFSNVGVKVGNTTTTVAADVKTDTVTLIQGSNVTLTADTTNDTITIAAKDTTYSAATTSAAGLMSADDKTKLNGIASGATKVTTDTVAGWGYTKNAGTVTGVKINGTTKSPSSGVVDLGTVITSHQDISGKLNKSGDTMTGDLTRKCTNVDASKANNNISSIIYPTTYNVIDNSDRILTRKEAIIEPNGNISAYWYVRNYNTSGKQIGQKGIKITMNKSGNMTYTVDDAANFRSAIGAGTSSFSGSYNDLSNKPTIPAAANNGTLTIQKNGTNVQTFTANQSTNATANITVPTKVSELTNDSGFTSNTGTVTSVAVKMNGSTKGTVTTSGTIDLGTVITSHQDISGKQDKITDLATLGFGIGVCSTAAATAAKTVSITNYSLMKNGFVAVNFANDVPANATLNINGKGAKPIIYKGAAITADTIKADDTVMFAYDGTNYVVTSLSAGEANVDEHVTIHLSSIDGGNLNNATVVVANADSQEIILSTTWSGENIKLDIQPGTNYMVTVGSVSSYVTPKPQTYYSFPMAERTISFSYHSDIGVYIHGVDGNLYTAAEWETAKISKGYTSDDVNGIALLLSTRKTLLAPGNLGTVSGWSKGGTSKDYNSAIIDYTGYQTSRDDNTGACAVALNYSFKDGSQGYLPAGGQVVDINNNSAAICALQTTCGLKTLIDSSVSNYSTRKVIWTCTYNTYAGGSHWAFPVDGDTVPNNFYFQSSYNLTCWPITDFVIS